MKQRLTLSAAFASLLYIPVLLFTLSCAPSLSKNSNVGFLQVDGQLQEDQEYLDWITPYKTKLDNEMKQVIAKGAKELKKNVGESPLGNLVADMQKNYSEKMFGQAIDISVVNNGGLRNSLPEGDITLGNIYELAPFENVIYLLELTAADVEKVARYAVKGKNLGMAGLSIEAKDGELESFVVGGEKVEPGKRYVLAINDYLANGGDHMDFLIALPRLMESDVLLREMLLDQMKEWTAAGKAIDAQIEGRQKLD
jgi:2',3'-cyclic-nucleotide 2'-phosphodiesterase (5'-nucleotidase family)